MKGDATFEASLYRIGFAGLVFVSVGFLAVVLSVARAALIRR